MKLKVNTNIDALGNFSNSKGVRKIADAFKTKDVVITFELRKKKRSNPQNRYYWGVIVPMASILISDCYGEIIDNNEAHCFLKEKFCKKEVVNKITSEIEMITISTSSLSTLEFDAYTNLCVSYIKDMFNVDVPAPGEQITIEL